MTLIRPHFGTENLVPNQIPVLLRLVKRGNTKCLAELPNAQMREIDESKNLFLPQRNHWIDLAGTTGGE